MNCYGHGHLVCKFPINVTVPAVAISDGERRALPRADEKVLFALEQEGERKGALEARQRRLHRSDRIEPRLHQVGEEMGDHLRVGFGLELSRST